MRVLSVGNMYPPHHLGGYELMWRSAVHHLREAGHEVRVLTTDYRHPDPDPGLLDDADVHRELRWYWDEHRFPRLSPRERLRLEWHNRRVLECELAGFRPDVLNWWAMGGMSLSLIERVRKRGLPAVGVVVDDWMLYGPKVDGWQRMTRRAGQLGLAVARAAGIPANADLGSSGEWIFVSETVRERARGAGWELPRTSLAPAGVDRSRFPQAPVRPWEGRLVYLGRIDARKGIATAIRALAHLPDATLRIVGDGDAEHRAELEELAAEIGVVPRVRFDLVRREEVSEVYAGADAVVFPVLWEEPWGLVPLEAMSVGRPVIATGAGGSGEYLRHEENCLLFEPRDDPRALADAALRVAGDEALRERLRRSGAETAARFSESAFNSAVARGLDRAQAG